MNQSLIWIAVVVCLAHSAMFSGLNLAFFSLSRLRLEAEAGAGNAAAESVLSMRRDSNFLLTTILWGNVGINVLLTLLSNSVLAGVAAFAFSRYPLGRFNSNPHAKHIVAQLIEFRKADSCKYDHGWHSLAQLVTIGSDGGIGSVQQQA